MMKNLLHLFTILSILCIVESCSLLSAAGITSQGQPTKEVEGTLTSTTANSSVNVDHSKWDILLKKYVNKKGLVDYKGFQNDRAALTSYLDQLSSLSPSNNWSVQELLAYYINLYNAVTVDLILDNPNVKSIKDTDAPWTKNRVTVNGRNLSLAGIENGILRKMNEPRIHFAINCASISCPPLLREAYTAGSINEQLDRATRDFINSEKNNIKKNNVELSSIFDFYTKDFYRGSNESLIPYINEYATVKVNTNAAVTFLPYNWDLNDQQ
ncbi:DUF547 domain-containing protein [Dokdonia sp. Hel_I_53]|uniref:DUF547 domain-containing protein n=1 Tax=Dokdonia sp. Hel_I_53 TaxID=1566287 RepID=UPI00119985CA|nr:DUF547 domain-containing protein [Dokdonia sp. Hel_I_53]TVZ53076.1 uncharacterized protein DUF547 [Dokdonia sp. Hel_I_53]